MKTNPDYFSALESLKKTVSRHCETHRNPCYCPLCVSLREINQIEPTLPDLDKKMVPPVTLVSANG